MRLWWLASGIILSAQATATDLNQALQQCLAIEAQSSRLQCYDQLAQRAKSAPALPVVKEVSGQASAPATSPAPAEAANPTAAFGLEQRAPENQLDNLQLTVKSVRKTVKGRLEITMENGQIWRQSDDSSLDVKSGDLCRVERAFMGSFLLSNGRSNLKIRVRRVD